MFMYASFCDAAEKIVSGFHRRKQLRGVDKIFDALRVYRFAGLKRGDPAVESAAHDRWPVDRQYPASVLTDEVQSHVNITTAGGVERKLPNERIHLLEHLGLSAFEKIDLAGKIGLFSSPSFLDLHKYLLTAALPYMALYKQ